MKREQLEFARLTNAEARSHRKWVQIICQSSVIFAIAVVAGVAVNFFRADGLPWRADWSAINQLSPDAAENFFISLDEAKIRFFTQSAVFIDARSQELYRAGHIQGALNLPFQDFDNRFPEVVEKIPLETAIITYCDGVSCNLSEELALSLEKMGYQNVQVLTNGWTLWRRSNLPIATGGG